MTGAILNNRYRLDSELGQGGMGVVYRGYDLLLGRDVAIKLLNKAGLGTQGRARLLREAQAVAKLNHPNIITVYDAGEADGAPFIVMELLSGLSLYEQKPASIDELVEVARQVCAALGHAHEHGIVHRDLKPENVILTSRRTDGAGELRVKLTDFGLARSVTSRQTIEGGLTGTVFYMPPEQAMGRELDGRADLYSLGVMLYELAAGRLPFAGDDPLTVIAQHLHAPAVPPSTFNPKIPAPLESLIMRLMGKQPEDRPATAEEVGLTLERIARKSTDLLLAAAQAAELSPLERLVRGRLVGRDAELAEARVAWQNATGDESNECPHVLLISGESGVGKTPFVRALRALAEVSRGRWLHGECYAEGGAPYSGFDQALSSTGEIFSDPAAITSLPPWAAGDLVRIAPSLRSTFGEGLESEGDRTRLFESVLTAFGKMIQTARGRTPAPSPLMLVIEDVQWADTAALALLRHVARQTRATGLKMLTVLTYRETELTGARGLNDLLLDFTRERLATRIRLEPFSLDQTAELLAVMFQQAIPQQFAQQIHRETEGNLFYVEEVCKSLIEDGTLSRSEGCWEFPQELCCEALPQTVRLMVQARIEKLSSATQDALRIAAVIGREFDFETLRQAGDFGEDSLLDALDEAQRAQIIAEVRDPNRRQAGQETFRFLHNLIALTLRESISGMRRRRLHRRVGEVIEVLQPTEHAALAYHFSQAGDDRRAVTHYRQAGDAAKAVYANADAVSDYCCALDLMPNDTPERFDTLLARADTYNLVGRRAEQKADIDELLVLSEKLADESRRFEALLAQAEYDLNTQHLHAREPAQRAVEVARRLGDKAREGRALVCLGMDARLRGDLERSRPALELAATCLREVSLIEEAAACLMTLSLTLGDLGEFERALAAVSEAVRLSRQAGNKRLEGVGLRRTAIALTEQRRFAEALPYAEEALVLLRQVGEPVEQCHTHNVLGITKVYLGRGAEAEEHWRAGLPLAEATESAVAGLYVLGNMAYAHFAWRGEYLAAIALLNDQLQKPYLGQNAGASTELRIFAADLSFTLGLYEQTLNVMPDLIIASASLLSQGITPATTHANRLAIYGRMLAEAGRPVEARKQLNAALPELLIEKPTVRHAAALIVWGYGVLALSDRNQAPRVVDLIESGLARYGESAAWNYDSASAHRLLAELYLQSDKNELALEHSQKGFGALGLRQYGIERHYLTLARALCAAGRLQDAAEAIRAAYQRVLLVASRTPDPEVQAAWLENVADNRAIIAWWEAINQPGADPGPTAT
jgi:eukaryotic-like serine/threonine-protein kinase